MPKANLSALPRDDWQIDYDETLSGVCPKCGSKEAHPRGITDRDPPREDLWECWECGYTGINVDH